MTSHSLLERSVAMTADVEDELRGHLLRADQQEDLCFALWHPSTGEHRTTALLRAVVLPLGGERNVHGNASFEPGYFLRAVALAAADGAGIALLHSHPGGRSWQGLSRDDYNAEAGHAAQTKVVTGRPLIGLTLAGDGTWASRTWNRAGDHDWRPDYSRSVRVIGRRWRVSFHPQLAPVPRVRPTHLRTVSAWGPVVQADIGRLRVGVIGAGSVGALVAEGLVRIGVGDVRIIDFDTMREHNLDRQLHAALDDIGDAKAEVLLRSLRRSMHNTQQQVHGSEFGITEQEGFLQALDCDVLFSCVDRPWPRAVLNLIAYAHGIPVVDGGVAVRVPKGRFLGADWRAHIAAPGRRCLECLGQYDPGLVELERSGLLDDSTYFEGLPADHILRRNENVFSFSMGCASLELAQFVAMLTEPNGIGDLGALHFHLTTGLTDRDVESCKRTCPYSANLVFLGDDAPVRVTAPHAAAEHERASRRAVPTTEPLAAQTPSNTTSWIRRLPRAFARRPPRR
jgi:hypothetical protein